MGGDDRFQHWREKLQRKEAPAEAMETLTSPMAAPKAFPGPGDLSKEPHWNEEKLELCQPAMSDAELIRELQDAIGRLAASGAVANEDALRRLEWELDVLQRGILGSASGKGIQEAPRDESQEGDACGCGDDCGHSMLTMQHMPLSSLWSTMNQEEKFELYLRYTEEDEPVRYGITGRYPSLTAGLLGLLLLMFWVPEIWRWTQPASVSQYMDEDFSFVEPLEVPL